jgi:hypothetical protein
VERTDKPIVENDRYIKILYDPNAILLKEQNNKSDKIYPIYISQYAISDNRIFWRVRFLHIRISGLASRHRAIEAGKSLVQAYLQGKTSNLRLSKIVLSNKEKE